MPRLRTLLASLAAVRKARGLDLSDLAVLAGLAILWSGLDAAIGPSWARVIVGALLLTPAALPVVAVFGRKP